MCLAVECREKGREGREREERREPEINRGQKDEVSLVLSAGSLYHQHAGMAHPHKQLLYLVSSCLSPSHQLELCMVFVYGSWFGVHKQAGSLA